MGRSLRELYLHFVWTTEDRDAVLRGELEHFVHRRFRQIAEDHGLTMVAANSAWDHVHLLVQWNTTTRIDNLVREWKSRTYTEWNGDEQAGSKLAWQEGCGVFSVSPHDVEKLKNYIANQKSHHRDDTTVHRYERRYGSGNSGGK